MAFQRPQQRPQASRQQPAPVVAAPPEPTASASQQRKRPLVEESQEWILFSPRSTHSQTLTSQTARTTNLSHTSDFGSLETGIRSDQRTGNNDFGADVEDDEAAELDSLDDGLHAFHAPSPPHLDQSGGTVLPGHDGLGTFKTNYNYGDNDGMQEHLWQYEKFNPHRRRTHRRRSSLAKPLDSLEEEGMQALDPQEERRLRVEKWRMEQSKAVLDEIEKESRRRQRRMSRMSGPSGTHSAAFSPQQASGSASRPIPAAVPRPSTRADDKVGTESFWQRITRRVIRDLIGLDETTLSVIFGEDLPSDDLSATPTQISPLARLREEPIMTPHIDDSWEKRLIDRIARELGVLVNQLSEVEGAFSTYTNAELGQDFSQPKTSTIESPPGLQIPRAHPQRLTSSDGLFRPTLLQNDDSPATGLDASHWGVEEDSERHRLPADVKQVDEYWQRDPSIRMIFDYLRNRFSSNPPSPGRAIEGAPASAGVLPATWATMPSNTGSALGTSPESLRRADLIRRHHPLVSRASEHHSRRRESLLRRHLSAQNTAPANNSISLLQNAIYTHRRAAAGSSSCASQSTKRSRKTRSGSAGTGTGSRAYWDFPGGNSGESVVSSAAGAGNAAGNWGEV